MLGHRSEGWRVAADGCPAVSMAKSDLVDELLEVLLVGSGLDTCCLDASAVSFSGETVRGRLAPRAFPGRFYPDVAPIG